MNKTKRQLNNCSKNLNYLIKCVNPSFCQATYVSGQTFKGMNISLSTLKNILSGRSVSDKTLGIIANSFSNYLQDPKNQRISDTDFILDPVEFKTKFPEISFKSMGQHDSYSLGLYTNKLYRCYYMISSSPYTAYMAYFKLFEKNKELSAYMVRGIQDFKLAKDIFENFDNPNNLIQCIKYRKKQSKSSKKLESINLFIANANAIKTSPNCIKIDFTSMEDEPCHSSMFWNISTTSRMASIESYIGGTALIVDTNDGLRGKDICSFKIGLEAVDRSQNSEAQDIDPINNTSPELINELSIKSRHGVSILDNGDDARWFRFLQEDINRTQSSKMYKIEDIQDLAQSLLKLKHDYTSEVERLKSYVEQHIEKK